MKKKKNKKPNPEEVIVLNELEELLNKLGIEFKYEKGFFKGGICRIEDKQYFYLSKSIFVSS